MRRLKVQSVRALLASFASTAALAGAASAAEPATLGPVDRLSIALAKEHQQQGRLEDAEAQLDRVPGFALEHAEAVALRGDIARERGDWAEAELLFRRAIDLSPKQANLYLRLGQALQSQAKTREADAAFARYLALSQESAP